MTLGPLCEIKSLRNTLGEIKHIGQSILDKNEKYCILTWILTWNRNPIGYDAPPHNANINNRLRQLYMATGKKSHNCIRHTHFYSGKSAYINILRGEESTQQIYEQAGVEKAEVAARQAILLSQDTKLLVTPNEMKGDSQQNAGSHSLLFFDGFHHF